MTCFVALHVVSRGSRATGHFIMTVLAAAAIFAETAMGAVDVDVHATNDALATNMSTPVTPTAVRRRDSRRARDVAVISNLWWVKTDTALSGRFMGRLSVRPGAQAVCARANREGACQIPGKRRTAAESNCADNRT